MIKFVLICFAVGFVVSAVVTGLYQWYNKPVERDEHEDLGK